jgi:hypothetical protein
MSKNNIIIDLKIGHIEKKWKKKMIIELLKSENKNE